MLIRRTKPPRRAHRAPRTARLIGASLGGALALGALLAAACSADPIIPPPAPGAARPSLGYLASPYTPPTGAAAVQAVLTVLGPTRSAADAAGFQSSFLGVYDRYAANFDAYEPAMRASADCCVNGGPYDNYYDRVSIYHAWWARSGESNADYLTRAKAVLVPYRTWLRDTLGWRVEPHDAQLDGLALDYVLTGDEESRSAVGIIADRFTGWYYLGSLSDTRSDIMDGRMQARTLVSFLMAQYIGAPSAQGNDWGARSVEALDKILASQAPDGSYKFPKDCRQNKPWMVGMVNDALIRYYTLSETPGVQQSFALDAARKKGIFDAVKKAVDYMWAKDWVSSAQAFKYLDRPCAATGQPDEPAPDLNLMIVNGYGWVGQQYKQHNPTDRRADATARSYFDKGDAVFAGGVNGACAWCTDKHFNQQYTSSYRYLGYRPLTVQ